jgi:hypothetical protein
LIKMCINSIQGSIEAFNLGGSACHRIPAKR